MSGLIRTLKGARQWDVRYSKPEERTYHGGLSMTHEINKYAIVIADTAATAIAVIQGEHPDATIHQVNCKGNWESVRIFVQSAMIVTELAEE